MLGQPMHSNTTTTLRSTKCLGGSSEPCIQAQTTASHIPQANSRHLIGGARCECYQHVNRRYNNATCVHRLPVCTLYVRRRLLSVCLRRIGPQALCPPRPRAPPPPCPAGPDTGPSPLPWAQKKHTHTTKKHTLFLLRLLYINPPTTKTKPSDR